MTASAAPAQRQARTGGPERGTGGKWNGSGTGVILAGFDPESSNWTGRGERRPFPFAAAAYFIGLLAGRTRKLAAIEEIDEAAAQGRAGRK
ncbi:MAG: hypothetical protein LBP86_03325 [Azoarcus sp.]|jgi:hypothetical protein|nr:hypothetical protein [Azoarcus sp.]